MTSKFFKTRQLDPYRFEINKTNWVGAIAPILGMPWSTPKTDGQKWAGLINTSTKQKLNTRSSTETELVAADNFMPIILWTNYFLEAQGYGHQDTILFQDN